ncbi:MAG: methyltransferase type 12 [uncultured bacterium]|nr:MAG: methyltransferase type 12 [uncultured bacterium]
MSALKKMASYYSILFPGDAAKNSFIENNIPKDLEGIVIDLACRTGQQLEYLSDKKYDVIGLDLEIEMLNDFKKRRKDFSKKIFCGDMRDADICLKEFKNQARLVYCVGNSLVQLTNFEDIHRTLIAIKNLLKADGNILIQTVNFDRVISGDYEFLPNIDKKLPGGGSIYFERRYSVSSKQGFVNFETCLVTPDGTESNKKELLALQKGDLKQLLTEVGFKDLKFYGDFNGSDWDEENTGTIVTARKSAAK